MPTAVGELDLKLRKELDSFQDLWKGGYFEGDPLDPLAPSSYMAIGYMSVLHAIYLACIRPYVGCGSSVLEIGPGRGAWTKTFLQAKEVWCLDALSAEHNGFWQYLGQPANVKYFQVSDFSCRMLPDDHFTYLFSFGALCHVSLAGISEYMKNLHPKLKSGAHGFILVADYGKYNAAIGDEMPRLNILDLVARRMAPKNPLLRWTFRRIIDKIRTAYVPGHPLDVNEDEIPRPSRFFHAGVDRTCEMLQGLGYEVLDPDIGASLRDPIIHFQKP